MKRTIQTPDDKRAGVSLDTEQSADQRSLLENWWDQCRI